MYEDKQQGRTNGSASGMAFSVRLHFSFRFESLREREGYCSERLRRRGEERRGCRRFVSFLRSFHPSVSDCPSAAVARSGDGGGGGGEAALSV